MEKFIVKHYIGEAHPSIKGNGFDGLVIGNEREDADEFIEWINPRLVSEPLELQKHKIYNAVLIAGRKIRDEACSAEDEYSIAEKTAETIINLITA